MQIPRSFWSSLLTDDLNGSTPVHTPDSASYTRCSVSQKKFIPWKCPMALSTPDTDSLPPAPLSQLIIVTSLIDKIPNIGGLSRSCEVFGASLVVDSLDITNSAEFKALSMTSEKHINIIEVY